MLGLAAFTPSLSAAPISFPGMKQRDLESERVWIRQRDWRRTPLLAAFSLVALRSNSRPREVCPARRQRMLKRPSYDRPTGLNTQVNFLNCPTSGGTQGRTKEAGPLRRQLKMCRNPHKLMRMVRTAMSESMLEPSVLSSATQTCGYQGWWQELLALLQIQQEEELPLHPTSVNIALTALANCLKQRGAFGIIGSRAGVALSVAKQLWQERNAPKDSDSFNCALSSALKLATIMRSEAAHEWGLAVWGPEHLATFPISGITYSTYFQFLEQYQHCEEVDALLDTMPHVLNYVVLSGLLSCVASRRDWRRAEKI